MKIYLFYNIIVPLFIQLTSETTALTDQITEWSQGINTVLQISTGVFAIVGGFLIFIQYMQGNDQAQKNFIKFVIGLSIFGLVTLISQFFVGA